MPPGRHERARARASHASHARRGFALPLALLALVVLALLTAILLDGAVQELRAARGEVALARAQAATESAIATLLATPTDSAFLTRARGDTRESRMTLGSDTVRVVTQALGGGLARVVVSARTVAEGVRADASTQVLLQAVPDTIAGPGAARFRRLPGWWWSAHP